MEEAASSVPCDRNGRLAILGGMSDVTRILSQIEQGDPHAAEQLLPLIYEELRKLAAVKLTQEKAGQTLNSAESVAAEDGRASEELRRLKGHLHRHLVMNMDLVITIDTSVAHLTGGLGKPVWVLLSRVAEFRWLRDRTDSPWYPTMRLFRQASPGHWRPVIREIADALPKFFAKASRSQLKLGSGG